MWVAQHWQISRPERHLTSGGLGAMGYGLPAGIGAALGGCKEVIVVSGDGSFMMNVQELATVRRYGIPLKIIVLDNSSLGMVRQWQELFFDGRYSEVDLSDNPDFTDVARAFGIPAMRLEGPDAVARGVRAIAETPGPLLLHVPIDRGTGVWPLVPPGRSNAEMMEESPP
jgi:acetolactate synthase-1/2/3 large subunit